MARTNNLTNFLTDVADSIREKTGKSDPIPCEDFDTEIESISGGGEPNLQDKSVTITENTTTTITADSGYDGLNEVAITTNVPTGGDVPTVGTIFSDWDSSGYPHTAQYKGRNTIGSYYFAVPSNNLGITSKLENIILPNDLVNINNFAFYNITTLRTVNIPNAVTVINQSVFSNCTNLETIDLPDTVTTIGQSAFYNCKNLELTKLPNSLTSLSNGAFGNCLKLAVTQIPSGVTSLPNTVFGSCYHLTKISMTSVTRFGGTSSTLGSFYYCTGLKQVWIGSAITDAGATRYAFQGCKALEKMYIDLPRATVEAFTYYQVAFMNDASKVGIIVCNDDSDWINKATFDAMNV